MDINTGSLRMLGEDEVASINEVQLGFEELTDEQLKAGHVELNDRVTIAGKKRHKAKAFGESKRKQFARRVTHANYKCGSNVTESKKSKKKRRKASRG